LARIREEGRLSVQKHRKKNKSEKKRASPATPMRAVKKYKASPSPQLVAISAMNNHITPTQQKLIEQHADGNALDLDLAKAFLASTENMATKMSDGIAKMTVDVATLMGVAMSGSTDRFLSLAVALGHETSGDLPRGAESMDGKAAASVDAGKVRSSYSHAAEAH